MLTRTRLFLAALLALAGLSATPAFAAPPEWLIGRWEKTQDPDGGVRDWLTFNKDGTAVINYYINGRAVRGTYVAEPAVTLAKFKLRDGSPLELTIRYSDNNTRLTATNSKTGSVSTYQRAFQQPETAIR